MASLNYKIEFMYRMAARNMITMFVDGRGTGFKGRAFRSAVSKQLGLNEVKDQVAAAKFVVALD